MNKSNPHKIYGGKYFKLAVISALSALLIASLALGFIAYSTEAVIKEEVLTSEINQVGDYSYKAFVSPALIYGNRTVISVGEPIYLKLLRGLNITFTYSIKSPQGIKEISGIIKPSITLSSLSWRRTYRIYDAIKLNKTSAEIIFSLNFTKILNEVARIESEIGIKSGGFNITIRPVIGAKPTLGNGRTYYQSFIPTLVVKVRGGNPLLQVSGLSNAKNYADKKVVQYPTNLTYLGLKISVDTARKLSLISSVILSPALGTVLLKSMKKEDRDELTEIMSKYRDLIVEGKVKLNPSQTIIRVKNFNELVNISEREQRTIIRDGRTLYIIEPSNIYYYEAAKENQGKIKR